jgi:hypothetical protein
MAQLWSPGSLSGQGVKALVHDSLVPKVLGCKASAPGAVVQGDVSGLPGPVMLARVHAPPHTAARSPQQVREAFRVLLEEDALVCMAALMCACWATSTRRLATCPIVTL